MGEPDTIWVKRIELLTPFCVTSAVVAATGNPHIRFIHCLSAFHNGISEVGEVNFQTHGVNYSEVTKKGSESPASVVFDQAENRMHTIKVVLVATLGT